MNVREIIARAIDPEVWKADIPVPTRDDTIGFHRRRQQANAQTVAILSALEEAGYAVVPREPTKEMAAAGEIAVEEVINYGQDSYTTWVCEEPMQWAVVGYRAMISAFATKEE